MAIMKCKMCGGDLEVTAGVTVAECEYCGTRQTVPSADNEKKLTLFARANRLRAAGEFDKAAGIYESIVADFPEEAEAYWGLVLCKYGIEYVDDPATGKKVPTCHRTSFDSLLTDPNFEQAQENADLLAQTVYRDEAKQIERLRKQIVAVSSSEKPYDIFICYKETDPYGNRTLDSVLAQDLYSALTDKGYRVFFSRITLQGKLGEAYEPYIFAALNSAKVMLAVGTRYEYYTSVWVKNEWSRYLKLCQTDKSKHLIPCYKDIDPEDIPPEFNHLQGADLGKMGAIQDILFNMEKYIPLKQETVIHEQVIIESGGQQKIASLLDRGRMALEDGDFANADGFFEEVLNYDSKNARAYLGKFLANRRCVSLAVYENRCMESCKSTKQTRYSLEPDHAHVDRIIGYYGKTFADKYNLARLYRYDLQYMSIVPQMEQLEARERTLWVQDKWLTKAVQFAQEPFATELSQAKDRILGLFSQAIRDAREQQKAAEADLRQRYEAHLAAVDKQAAAYYEQEQVLLEQRYGELLKTLENANSQRGLRNLAEEFDKLGNFRDSREKAETCRNNALELDYQAGLTRLRKADSERELLNLSQYFAQLGEYKDSRELACQCENRAAAVRKEQEQKQEQEKQHREKMATANRSLAQKLLIVYVVLCAVLFIIGVLSVGSDINKETTASAIGGLIGAFFIQLLVCILPVAFCLVQLLMRGKKEKLSTVFMVLTLVASGIGLLVWGILIAVFVSTEGITPMSFWCIDTAAINLLSMALSFIRKR